MQNDPGDEQGQEFSDTEKFWVRVTLYKLIYAISGLIMGIACIAVGIILVLNKLTGYTIKTISRSELISVAPWAVLFIIGFSVIAVTRYSKLSAKNEYYMIERDFAPRLSVSHRIAQEAASKRFWKTVNTFTLVYSIFGLISGAGLILGGIVLSLRMITDEAAHVFDGISGVMLFGVGLFVIAITRYRVKAKDIPLTNPQA
jgi:nitrate reductase gamma subunit